MVKRLLQGLLVIAIGLVLLSVIQASTPQSINIDESYLLAGLVPDESVELTATQFNIINDNRDYIHTLSIGSYVFISNGAIVDANHEWRELGTSFFLYDTVNDINIVSFNSFEHGKYVYIAIDEVSYEGGNISFMTSNLLVSVERTQEVSAIYSVIPLIAAIVIIGGVAFYIKFGND